VSSPILFPDPSGCQKKGKFSPDTNFSDSNQQIIVVRPRSPVWRLSSLCPNLELMVPVDKIRKSLLNLTCEFDKLLVL
jgi:hypothetical protein